MNKLDRTSDSNKLTTKAMVRYTQPEIEYLKLIVDSIMESDERELGEIQAINVCRDVKSRNVRSQVRNLIAFFLCLF